MVGHPASHSHASDLVSSVWGSYFYCPEKKKVDTVYVQYKKPFLVSSVWGSYFYCPEKKKVEICTVQKPVLVSSVWGFYFYCPEMKKVAI